VNVITPATEVTKVEARAAGATSDGSQPVPITTGAQVPGEIRRGDYGPSSGLIEAVRMLQNSVMVALLVVAVALGLNNFGAAIAIGVSGVDRRTGLKVATVFGLCDVVMPATGMLIGAGLAGPLGSAARWAGAGILFVTAVWGLIEALRGGDDGPKIWHGWRLLVSGAALSLDDLAVGLALGTVRFNIVLAVTLFGAMSFIMSIIGLKLGGKLGTAAGEHGEVVGAAVLIGISGAMAMGWLLSTAGNDGRLQRGPGQRPGL
jgi:putative Mn2+ efflux pump MntP